MPYGVNLPFSALECLWPLSIVLLCTDAHGAVEPCVVSKLLHVATASGVVCKDKPPPRALTAGKAAAVVLTLERPMAMETFEDSKALGRFTLRAGDATVAQGMVTKMQPQ